MSKRPYLRTPFGKQRFSGFEILLKSARHHYYQMFPGIWDKLIWKNSASVGSEILRLFAKTLRIKCNYSRLRMQTFPQQLQTQLSRKQETFCGFFIAFLKCTSSLKHFEKKYQACSLNIPRIIDSKGSGYLNA